MDNGLVLEALGELEEQLDQIGAIAMAAMNFEKQASDPDYHTISILQAIHHISEDRRAMLVAERALKGNLETA